MTEASSPSGDTPALPPAAPLPASEDFFLRTPLYEFHEINGSNAQQIAELEYYQGTFDSYCPSCKQTSIFEREDHRWPSMTADVALRPRIFRTIFHCSRLQKHYLYFEFLIAEDPSRIGKIGQWPSLADLQVTSAAKYRRLLGEERHRELTRAIGLAAHGVGIGSFVYLRRVFESLIEEAHAAARQQPGFDEEAFDRGRMDDRILLLSAHLPAFLVENRSLYGILSKGIHSLTEAECLKYFDTVRVGIELILDEKLEQAARLSKLEEAKRAIGEVRGILSS